MHKDKKCRGLRVAKWLLIIGGINWGLVGIGMIMGASVVSWNLIHAILGGVPALEGIIYVLVGIAAIMKIFGCKCKGCKAGGVEEKKEASM